MNGLPDVEEHCLIDKLVINTTASLALCLALE